MRMKKVDALIEAVSRLPKGNFCKNERRIPFAEGFVDSRMLKASRNEAVLDGRTMEGVTPTESMR